MGKAAIILTCLAVLIAGTIILLINHDHLRLVMGLSEDADAKLAKFISNTYAHNAVKDVRAKFIEQLNIIIDVAPNIFRQEYNVLGVNNSEATVYIYTDSLPGVRHLNLNQEWGIMSIGRVNAAICTTKTIYKRMPYAEFGLFSNSFPNAYYYDGEMVDGPVYINGKLGVGTAKSYSTVLKDFPSGAGPVFTDIVFVTQSVVYTPASPYPFERYFKGFKAGAPIINHPIISMPIKNTLMDIGIDFSKNYQLTTGSTTYSYIFLRGDKVKLSINSIENDGDDVVLNIADLKSKGYILYNGNAVKALHVKGFMKGRLSIITQGYLYADSSIVYESVLNNSAFIQKCINGEGPTLPNKDQSILGLFCNNNFIVSASSAPSNYDVLITANIMTNKTIFMVENNNFSAFPWSRISGAYKPRSCIVYGGRTQNALQTQTFSGNYGLKEVITYDRRLKEKVPPGAPYTDKGARISYWDEKFARVRH